ncbi:hypothetical protein J2Y68_000660 [Paenarthrobacter nitroguajacolicus]|nr:hypothetical protein [Paenarthrobacter nitroguajacolicus]
MTHDPYADLFDDDFDEVATPFAVQAAKELVSS